MYQNLLLAPSGEMRKLLLAIAMIWSLIWKGIALWKSSKNDHKYWFIALFLLNTLGILPIVYILFFSKKKTTKKKK